MAVYFLSNVIIRTEIDIQNGHIYDWITRVGEQGQVDKKGHWSQESLLLITTS